MNKLKIGLIVGVLSLMVFGGFAIAPTVKAASNELDLWGDLYSENQIGFLSFNTIGLGKRDPRAIAAATIQVLMGFLGLIAVVLILFGGFKWMTSNGSDAKIAEARKLMTAGVVGLLIVLASFAVSIFVTRVLPGVTGGAAVTYDNTGL